MIAKINRKNRVENVVLEEKLGENPEKCVKYRKNREKNVRHDRKN